MQLDTAEILHHRIELSIQYRRLASSWSTRCVTSGLTSGRGFGRPMSSKSRPGSSRTRLNAARVLGPERFQHEVLASVGQAQHLVPSPQSAATNAAFSGCRAANSAALVTEGSQGPAYRSSRIASNVESSAGTRARSNIVMQAEHRMLTSRIRPCVNGRTARTAQDIARY